MFIKNILLVIAVTASFVVGAKIKPSDINPAVTVVWDNPQDFRDVDAANGIKSRYLERVLTDFERYFHRELPKHLETTQKITVTIFDIDLAGDIRPMLIQGNDVRLVSSMYPPMIDLEYVITDLDGVVIKGARRKLRDIGFNIGSASTRTEQALAYEKQMLKRWLTREFR